MVISSYRGKWAVLVSPQVGRRELASSRFENPSRFRESLVTMPAAQKKMSSWNQAGLTGSRIIMAGGGLARPVGRNHLPRWLRLDDLSKISLQPQGPPDARHDISGFSRLPLTPPAYSPPLAQSFLGVWRVKSRNAPISPQEDLRYKAY